YAKCGCFRDAPPPSTDLKAAGPERSESRVDYQDVAAYLEVAVNDKLSGFVEMPLRFLNPEQNNNTAGLADMNAGFKVAVLAGADHMLTFQLRTHIPSGDADKGLGTNHASMEPAFLFSRRLTERL